ncbi:putative MFS family arabinose efflux permease [Sphingomonas aurantiaca]|uniref:Putative MFS family arabinose efflux permease n=1 Tax=Sphingomonas aurantiaca TaxID=185949 RepID=A0A2T5GGJ8_9SPHN|nr:MFS transporter [Sphingomonas aurantiaca]PTQ58444.1 putative MFS family arabinose efflux permease [Sphingomonas aurantiaca]
MITAERQAGTLQGILLLLPITMAVMGLIVLVPILPAMMAHYRDVPGFDYLIPLMLTLPALCVAVLSPVAGVVVDFFGRRKTCIGALVIYSIVGILPIFLESLSAIIISRVVLGAMEALVVISSTTLIGDYFHGRDREKWLANQTAVASLSSIFLALLGGALGSFGWRGAFAAYGVSIVFAIALLLWTWEPRKSDEPLEEFAAPGARFPWSTILPISLLAIFGGTMFFTMQIQVSSMLSEYYGISSTSALGLYSGLAGLSVAAGTLLYRRFTARFITPTQLLIAFGLLGVSYVLMNYSPTPQLFTTWLVVNQIGSGMLLPALVVSAMGRLPFEVRGRGTGMFMSGWWLGQPLSSQAVAFMRGHNGGDLPATLQILGILCLVAAAIALASRFRGSSRTEASAVG